MNFLKNHPFPVEAYFTESVVLTFAIPKEYLLSFLPECLTLDTFQDKYAFIAVAMVQTTGLRPQGMPAFLGNNFFLIGYRIFVRYRNSAGKNLRGLYILKSETDKKKMEILGNIFTHYNYTTTDIEQEKRGDLKIIHSNKSGFKIAFSDKKPQNISLPQNSVFTDWKEARRFAGPLPHTFSYNAADNTMLIIQGLRQNWTPEPIEVIKYNFTFLDKLDLPDLVLANAFQIKNVPYRWKKGKIEKLTA